MIPRKQTLLSLLFVLAALPVLAIADAVEIDIDAVLSLGPLPTASEPFADSSKAEPMRRALVDHFDQQGLPRDGQSTRWFGQSLSWGRIHPAELDEQGLMVWSVNLEAERFIAGKLEVAGLAAPVLFLHGKARSPSNGTVDLHLPAGSHQLLIIHRGRDGDDAPALRWQGRAEHDRISHHTEARRRVSAQRLTNAETVNAMALSPDGRYLALSFSGRLDSADADLRRTEIHDLEQSRIVRQWTSQPPRALAWSPDGRWLAVQEGQHLWLHDRDGRTRLLLANHEHVGQWQWHPDSGSIFFAWTTPDDSDNRLRRRFRSLEDRWANFRDNSQLFQVDVDSGMVRPLTRGERSISLLDVDPTGERLLLSQRLIDYAEPPHSLFRLFEMNVDSLEERDIAELRQFNGARFAPEGYWLLAGPGLPIGDGATSRDELTPNEYDTQLYWLDADGKSARSLSRDFDPAFGAMHRLANGDLLLTATAAEQNVLVRFDADRERLSIVDTGLDIVEQFVASEGRRPLVVVRGTNMDHPQRVQRIELQRGRVSTLVDSKDSQYADVALGPVERWTFNNREGDEIDGRFYLPPDFDADRQYPLIVYYYGGTTPVNRQFTGRYPFHLWAAKGYVVYVLQPRGTIGYGQDFSALHVNAWGRYTADDIIEGTQKFVEAHSFIDGERIGNIGASYGGFMTMHLATLTDLYAASISHAGISAITSYWGEGWWGFGYSGIASRGSFPWNNQELYVGQSPVYSADQITTPLLLVTGDADTNVPPGESHNMFTALKLLGREVELVEFPGEDHHILDREQRYVWWDTMLAWFDKYLKDQPEWWHHLYPETAPES
ncbi:MAG: S9 family peptidase [Wenzhouxiangella sp.]